MTNECKELGKRALLVVCAASMLFSFCEPGSAQVQSSPSSDLKLYDSFERKFLNPQKWSSEWQCGFPSVMECDRGRKEPPRNHGRELRKERSLNDEH